VKEIDKNSIDELLIRYLTGIAINEELVEAEKWLNSSEENRTYFDKFKSVWETSSNIKEYQEIDTESSLKNVKQRIDFKHKISAKVRALYVAMRVAAVLIIALGLFFIFKDNGESEMERKMVKIESLNELRTVSLPDGSMVTLNVASIIEYPENFVENERRVRFKGEAYFEVAPDKDKPFIIETEKSETRVVGTAFNLKALSETESESIVVTEGIVEFSGKTEKTKEPVRLVKGEIAVLTSELKKEKNTDLNFMVWKTGVLEFRDLPLKKALKEISSNYKVDIRTKDSVLGGYLLSVRLDNQKLSVVLELLEETLIAKFEKKGETYWLKKKIE